MVDQNIKDKINAKIDELEKYAYDHVEPCPGRNVYYDMVDAVGICRGALSGISESESNLSYLNEAIKALKNSRANYRYGAAGNREEAIALYTQAYLLAQQYIGDYDAVTESIGLRLAFY